MYPMKSNDEVLKSLKFFPANVGKAQRLVSDGALEFKSRGFSDVCRKIGLPQEFSGKWHFALKMDSLRRISIYKARLVARDSSQVPGLD